jgi:hypothetical protein
MGRIPQAAACCRLLPQNACPNAPKNMDSWLDTEGRFFSAQPQISAVPLMGQDTCWVVDNVLANPDGLVRWAHAQEQGFADPVGYPYPGVVLDAPAAITQGMADYFAQHGRTRLGARRTLGTTVRLSVVTTPPAQLLPLQWQCHRDRVADDPRAFLFAASVLYLFRTPALGGTSFYVPRLSAQATDAMLADSQLLDGPSFTAKHGVQPGYMNGSNAFFERVAQVPAAYNRAIFYDGGLFHSADVDQPSLLTPNPQTGRLTLNSFFSCTRKAG